MKAQAYSLDDIFDKGLLMLIPFHIFSHEGGFPEYDRDGGKLEGLKAEYKEILKRLDVLEERGKIGAFDKRTIVDLAGDVIVRESVRELVRASVKQTEKQPSGC